MLTWFSGILVFVISWWLFFFMMLPIGVQTQAEAGDEMVPGTVESAPKKPRLLRKAIAAAVLATTAVFFFDWLLGSQIITLRPTGI